jgi:hypothetical protein
MGIRRWGANKPCLWTGGWMMWLTLAVWAALGVTLSQLRPTTSPYYPLSIINVFPSFLIQQTRTRSLYAGPSWHCDGETSRNGVRRTIACLIHIGRDFADLFEAHSLVGLSKLQNGRPISCADHQKFSTAFRQVQEVQIVHAIRVPSSPTHRHSYSCRLR